MADQVSTPASATESSVAGSSKPSAANPAGASAPKDKACPFCGQPFTSSSLGRHLDLYIKEKNPKPSDGLHDVDEIRKMRGAITRRQPRGSSGRREGSTPAATPGGTPAIGLRGADSEMGTPSRSVSRASVVQRQPMTQEKGRVTTALNQVNWQSTGVINNIPIMHQRNDLNGGGPTGGAGAGAGDMGEGMGIAEGRRSVSRQMAAKNAHDQRQKVAEAIEGQRAAELALREILGSIKAALTVAQPQLPTSPFDFDPIALDFPSLVLTCLPPPPTIGQMTPIENPSCWFIDAPGPVQFKALSAHFRERFHSASILRNVTTSPPHPDDILYAHHAAPEVQQALAQQAQRYEEQVNNHLRETYRYWMNLPDTNRDQLWKQELARSVGTKSLKITQLEHALESTQQENAHLKYQVDSLSKLQNPKEFAMAPPQTLSLNSREAVKLVEIGMRGRATGFKLGDTEESLQKRVELAVERWRPIVHRSRAGMGQQRSLSGQMRASMGGNEMNGMQGHMNGMAGEGMDMDVDVDSVADADAEADEENYNQAQAQMQQHQQERVSGTNTPMVQPHMIQSGYPNINQQQQAQQQSLRGQQQQQAQQQAQQHNINGMAMMNLQQQQHAAAQQQAQQQQQQQMQQQNQAQAQNQGMQQGAQQEGMNANINGQHQGMNQAQQMAAMRRQQQQQQQGGVVAQMNCGRAGGRVNVPF